MGFSEIKCPHCGKMNRETCNTWMYDTPIRVCKNCNNKYLDKRYREVAIEGPDQRSVDPAFYLKGMGVMAFIFIGTLGILLYQINVRGYYSNRLLGCVLMGFLGFIACGVLFLRNRLGIETKNNQKYLRESESRLANKEYVQELIEFGYEVPDKYM